MGGFEDLLVKVAEREGRIEVAARAANGARAAGSTVVTDGLLDGHIDLLAGKRLDWGSTLAAGRALGRLLFPDGVHELLADVLDGLDDGGRLRIRVEAGGRAATVPWEFAYVDARSSPALSPYLVLDSRVTLVRTPVGAPPLDPAPGRQLPTLRRVLVAPATRLDGLDLLQQAEPTMIRDALLTGNGDTACVVLDDPVDLPALERALGHGCDVFHFTGHGSGGAAIFVAGVGGAARLPVAELGRRLAPARPRLVVLNACETGGDGGPDRDHALAAMVRDGVCAVVAMQHRIEDRHGATFSRALYESLAQGDTVEVAVARGRRAINTLGTSTEWAVPVLYMGAEAPFAPRQRRPSAAAAPVRYRVPQLTPGFTGRTGELAALGADQRSVRPGVTCRVLSGLGGVGKTQLAAAYVKAREQAFDVVAWIRAEHSPVADLAELGRRLGLPVEGRTPTEVAADVWDHLGSTERTWLVVLDNVEDRAVLRDIPVHGTGEVLATTRTRGGHEAIGGEVAIDTFDEQTATAYLLDRTGRTDDAGARRVAAALGGLPLALSMAASLCARDGGETFPMFEQLIEQVRAEVVFDSPLDTPGVATVARTWTMSIAAAEQTAPLAAEVLDTAAHLAPDAIPRSFLVPVDAPPERRMALADALRALHRTSLVDLRDDTVRIHRVLQKVVRDAADEERAAAAHRRALLAVDAVCPRDPGNPASWPEWLAVVPHVVELARAAPVTPVDAERLCRLLTTTTDFMVASGDPAGARTMAEVAVRTASKELGADHPATAAARSVRLDALALSGDHEAAVTEAEALVVDVVAGADAAGALSTRVRLVTALEALRRSHRAIEEATRLVDDCATVLGADHPTTREARQALATSLLSVGRASDATPILEGLMVGGAGSTATAISLAGCYRATGRSEEALDLGERTVAECAASLGPDHVTTLAAWFDLGSTLRSAGRLDLAIEVEERVVEARSRILGPRHGDTLWAMGNLGISYQSAGRTADASLQAERVVAERIATAGPEDSKTLTAFANQAISLRAAGRVADAVRLQEHLVEVRSRILGPDHFSTLSARHHLGISHRRCGRAAEAVATGRGVAADRDRLLGDRHPATLVARDDVAAALALAGASDEALTIGRSVVDTLAVVLGPDHPESLWARAHLARSLVAAGASGEARDVARRAQADGARVLGAQHPYVSWVARIPVDATEADALEPERVLWE